MKILGYILLIWGLFGASGSACALLFLVLLNATTYGFELAGVLITTILFSLILHVILVFVGYRVIKKEGR